MHRSDPEAMRPGEWPEQLVGLFVDTQNLYDAARDIYNHHVDYQRPLDLADVSDMFV